MPGPVSTRELARRAQEAHPNLAYSLHLRIHRECDHPQRSPRRGRAPPEQALPSRRSGAPRASGARPGQAPPTAANAAASSEGATPFSSSKTTSWSGSGRSTWCKQLGHGVARSGERLCRARAAAAAARNRCGDHRSRPARHERPGTRDRRARTSARVADPHRDRLRRQRSSSSSRNPATGSSCCSSRSARKTSRKALAEINRSNAGASPLSEAGDVSYRPARSRGSLSLQPAGSRPSSCRSCRAPARS